MFQWELTAQDTTAKNQLRHQMSNVYGVCSFKWTHESLIEGNWSVIADKTVHAVTTIGGISNPRV